MSVCAYFIHLCEFPANSHTTTTTEKQWLHTPAEQEKGEPVLAGKHLKEEFAVWRLTYFIYLFFQKC